MRYKLAILAASGALLAVLSFAANKNGYPWVTSALLNFGSGIVTAVLLTYLYDESRAKQTESERRDRERRVARSLKVVMRQHYRVLLDCYRSATAETSAPQLHSVSEFLGAGYADTVRYLDIYAPSPMSSDGRTPYFTYIQWSFKMLEGALRQALNYNAIDLRDEFAGAIEGLLESPMLIMSVNLSQICAFTPPGFPPHIIQFDSMEANIRDYCPRFCQLLDALENVEPQGLKNYKIEDWHNACFPFGHARRSPQGGPKSQ